MNTGTDTTSAPIVVNAGGLLTTPSNITLLTFVRRPDLGRRNPRLERHRLRGSSWPINSPISVTQNSTINGGRHRPRERRRCSRSLPNVTVNVPGTFYTRRRLREQLTLSAASSGTMIIRGASNISERGR